MPPSVSKPITIVLVEDDDGHATLIEKNLRRAGLSNGFHRLRDGQEALDYFSSREREAGNGPNCLVLLDIKMPRVDGIEVLRRLKSDRSTEMLPVIMLTTTDDPREVERCYQLGCNVYITKPVEYESFHDAITRLGLFLQVVQLPPVVVPTGPVATAADAPASDASAPASEPHGR